MQNKTKTNLLVWAGLVLGLVFLGYFIWTVWSFSNSNPEPYDPNPITNSPTTYAQKMAACQAIPNDSTQNIADTTRLFINLPKDVYPDKDHNLQFKTVSGNATSGYISNGGLPGEALQTTPDCWSYYNEFDGTGEVDLTVKSVISGMPDYAVKFVVK